MWGLAENHCDVNAVTTEKIAKNTIRVPLRSVNTTVGVSGISILVTLCINLEFKNGELGQKGTVNDCNDQYFHCIW